MTRKGKSKQRFLMQLSRPCFLAAGLFLSACSSTDKWQEEVQLSDGRVIVVDRELLREPGGGEWAMNPRGSKPKQYVIRFAHPDEQSKTIEWRSEKLDMQTWPEKPLILDIDAGTPTVYSIFVFSPGCKTYLKYIYRNGVWVEEPLPSEFNTKATNLFIQSAPAVRDLESKQKLNNSVDYRQWYKQVGPRREVCDGRK